MPITISVDGAALDGEGALDPDQVMIQFLCSTGPGEHDPDQPPDDHVRPTHAALHGRMFTLDAGAPIPPLDYGCRCAIRYVAQEKTAAARVLENVSDVEPEDSVTPAYTAWLQKNAPGWEKVAAAAEAAPDGQEAAAAYAMADKLGLTREIARMAMQVAVANKVKLRTQP